MRIIFTTLLFLVPNLVLANPPELLISKINLGYENSKDEYLEVFNNSSKNINLKESNFSLHIRNSKGSSDSNKRIAWINQEITPGGSFFLVSKSSKTFLEMADATYSPALVKNGAVYISYESKKLTKVIDFIAWGSHPLPDGFEGQITINPSKNEELVRIKESNTYIDTNGDDFLIQNIVEEAQSEDISETIAEEISKEEIATKSELGGEKIIPIITVQGTKRLSGHSPFHFNVTAEESYIPEHLKEVSYFWDFANGQSSQRKNPLSVRYDQTGKYLISLKITDENQQEHISYQEIQVFDKGINLISVEEKDFRGVEKKYEGVPFAFISKVAFNSAEDWIEISCLACNTGMNLDGYTLYDDKHFFEFPLNFFLSKNKRARIIFIKDKSYQKESEILFAKKNGLTKSDEQIVLTNRKKIVDAVCWNNFDNKISKKEKESEENLKDLEVWHGDCLDSSLLAKKGSYFYRDGGVLDSDTENDWRVFIENNEETIETALKEKVSESKKDSINLTVKKESFIKAPKLPIKYSLPIQKIKNQKALISDSQIEQKINKPIIQTTKKTNPAIKRFVKSKILSSKKQKLIHSNLNVIKIKFKHEPVLPGILICIIIMIYSAIKIAGSTTLDSKKV